MADKTLTQRLLDFMVEYDFYEAQDYDFEPPTIMTAESKQGAIAFLQEAVNKMEPWNDLLPVAKELIKDLEEYETKPPTIGSLTYDQEGNVVKVDREYFQQGYIFKDDDAFENRPDDVCYVPELSDTLYTKRDFVNIAYGNEDLAKDLFETVDWQSPESLLTEWEFDSYVLCNYEDKGSTIEGIAVIQGSEIEFDFQKDNSKFTAVYADSREPFDITDDEYVGSLIEELEAIVHPDSSLDDKLAAAETEAQKQTSNKEKSIDDLSI